MARKTAPFTFLTRYNPIMITIKLNPHKEMPVIGIKIFPCILIQKKDINQYPWLINIKNFLCQ